MHFRVISNVSFLFFPPQSVGASAEHHPVELLRVLVNGIGATIGCMELSTRDPVMTALSFDDQILSAHQRMLNVLYSISRVALQVI